MRFIACAAIGHWSSSCHNIDLKAYTWSFRVGSSSSSMDPGDLVYKVNSLVQSSLYYSLLVLYDIVIVIVTYVTDL